jgi:hypothetical protein
MHLLKRSYSKLPYVYFAIIWLWCGVSSALTGPLQSLLIALFAIPFLYQWKAERKDLNLILGVVMSCWSVIMAMAFISDLAKVITYSESTTRFILFGGTLVVVNFLMTALLFKNAVGEQRHTKAIA